MHFGGVEEQLLYLITGLDPDLYDLHLSLCEGGGESIHKVPAHVTIHVLNHRTHRGINISLIRKLVSLIRDLRPQIVISFHPSYNMEAYLATKMSFVKTKVIGCLPGKVGPGRLDSIRIPILKRLDRLICVGKGVELSLTESYGALSKRIIIPNCVDIPEIQKKGAECVDHPWLRNKSIPVGITVGRLIKSKGIDVAINAVVEVNKTRPFRLIIIGDGPDAARIKSIVSQAGARHFIDFLGYQDNPIKYVSKSNLFLFTSYEEGLPTVLIEAMVSQIPIISTSYLDGKGEIIMNRHNGILISGWDPKVIAEQIIEVLSDESLRNRLVTNAYDIGVSEHNKQIYIKRYTDLFTSLVK
jgi:glycosyltransferase involved in cell wall biosynthesis